MVSIDVLKKYPFFIEMSDDQLQELAAIATEESHGAGEMIYSTGDPANKLYMVVSGKIVMVMDTPMGPHRPPMRVNVDFLTGGESMGWSSLVEPHIYTLGALCFEKSEVIAFDAETLRRIITDDCALGLKVMQSTAKIIATRLNHFRMLLVGERRLSALTEF